MKDNIYANIPGKYGREHISFAIGYDVKTPKSHLGTHPMSETTCDYHECWCHKEECAAKQCRNGERCNCGVKMPLLP
jgi:hypothetical protein